MKLEWSQLKKKWWLVFLIFFVFLGGTRYLYQEISKLPPLEAVQQGLEQTLAARSYRFRVQASRSLAGKTTLISDLRGEKNGEGIYLKGVLPLIKADVEIYYGGDLLYRKDPFTQGWVKVPIEGRVGLEELIAELNPLGIFAFLGEDYVVNYAGIERVARKKCRVYEVMTSGENKYLELFWQDFNYILWVDRQEKFIRRAQITAEHRDNPQHCLQVVFVLTDYNATFELPVSPE